ncbi:MAG: class II aldolase/adducin family protein [Treponema sp.]|jgi:L-fuculose-phosphate aldolase|nr:class II aldolase/adducin family protein [Treponema sp.]
MSVNISQEAINDVLEAAHMMDRKGLMSTFEGNISVKRDGLLYITPTQTSKGSLTAAMIAVYDESGGQVAGELKASSELSMHTALYRMREGIGAVAHAHPPYLTAHAICHKTFTANCYPEFLALFSEIPVAPYGSPGSRDIYAGIEPLIQDHYVILLANHGALAVGSTAAKACARLEAAEASAAILDLANRVGSPVPLKEAEIARIRSVKQPI